MGMGVCGAGWRVERTDDEGVEGLWMDEWMEQAERSGVGGEVEWRSIEWRSKSGAEIRLWCMCMCMRMCICMFRGYGIVFRRGVVGIWRWLFGNWIGLGLRLDRMDGIGWGWDGL